MATKSGTNGEPADFRNWTSTIHKDTYPAISSRDGASNHDGRAVLVTGGAAGIGRATVLSFARAGASHIAALDKADFGALEHDIEEAAKVCGKAKPTILCLVVDVLDRAALAEAATKVEKSFGKLDFLLNNAGKIEPYVPLLDSDPDSWWKTWEVNIGGVANVTRAFLPLLLRSTSGLQTIINTSSLAALTLQPGGSAYQGTKLALVRWTEYLNLDYGAKGILAYCIAPGAIMTQLGSGTPKELHHLLQDTVELPADSVVWLTQVRREWLAGRWVSCNWDMPEFVGREKEVVEANKLKVVVNF